MFHVKHFVSDLVDERLRVYQESLSKWQKKINLVSPGTLSHAWERHFQDSLQLLSFLPDDPLDLIDLGSGAGFPGLVLAIAREKNLKVTLVESNFKKCAFLESVSRETLSEIKIFRSRIEDLPPMKKDVITARGLSSLSQLLGYAYPLMGENSFCLFLKGKKVEKEIKEARKEWNFFLEIFSSLTDPEGRILKISKVERLFLE